MRKKKKRWRASVQSSAAFYSPIPADEQHQSLARHWDKAWLLLSAGWRGGRAGIKHTLTHTHTHTPCCTRTVHACMQSIFSSTLCPRNYDYTLLLKDLCDKRHSNLLGSVVTFIHCIYFLRIRKCYVFVPHASADLGDWKPGFFILSPACGQV